MDMEIKSDQSRRFCLPGKKNLIYLRYNNLSEVLHWMLISIICTEVFFPTMGCVLQGQVMDYFPLHCGTKILVQN